MHFLNSTHPCLDFKQNKLENSFFLEGSFWLNLNFKAKEAHAVSDHIGSHEQGHGGIQNPNPISYWLKFRNENLSLIVGDFGRIQTDHN